MRYFEILREDITQTKTFKKWFAGSKIVDTNGRPLRLITEQVIIPLRISKSVSIHKVIKISKETTKLSHSQ